MNAPSPIGFVVDLDDTLYPQAEYLELVSGAVGERASELGLDGPRLARALLEVLGEGSDRGQSIDRALHRCDISCEPGLVDALVEAFVGFRPERLHCYPGAKRALRELRRHGPTACLSDGRPEIQYAKLAALGLREAFDLVVITDEIGGRTARKPSPAGLYRIVREFEIPMTQLVIIGDRPDKDVALALGSGARPIRVRQGEYAALSAFDSELTVESFPAAVAAIITRDR